MFQFMSDPDNLLGRILGRIGQIIVLNLLFLLFSLPIFTIGASLTTLYHTVMKIGWGRESVHIFEEFYTSFRENFRQCVVFWFLAAAFYAALYFSFLVSHAYGLVAVETALIFLGALVFTWLQYLFSNVASFKGQGKQHALNAISFLLSDPAKAAAVAVLNLIPLFLTFLDAVNQPTFVFCWFFFGFSLITFAESKIFLKLYAPYFKSNCEKIQAK